MRVRLFSQVLMAGLICLSVSPAAVAGTTTVPAGQILTLERDLMLAGADDLIMAGTAEQPCALEGQNHQIKTDAN